MSFDLSGQRILITGTAGGIGGAVTQFLAGLGACAVLIDQAPCGRLAVTIAGSGGWAGAGARHHLQRTARPEENPVPIAFLIHPARVSGTILDVNGGSLMLP